MERSFLNLQTNFFLFKHVLAKGDMSFSKFARSSEDEALDKLLFEPNRWKRARRNRKLVFTERRSCARISSDSSSSDEDVITFLKVSC